MAKKTTIKKPVKQAKAGAKKTKPKKADGRGKPNSGQFKKNNPDTGYKDPRINRTGQNAKYTELHHLLTRLFDEDVSVTAAGDKTFTISRIEFMMREWIVSKDFNKQKAALEYFAGKVPDELKTHNVAEELIKQNLSLLTDGQIERLKGGEPAEVVIIELLDELKQIKENNE